MIQNILRYYTDIIQSSPVQGKSGKGKSGKSGKVSVVM